MIRLELSGLFGNRIGGDTDLHFFTGGHALGLEDLPDRNKRVFGLLRGVLIERFPREQFLQERGRSLNVKELNIGMLPEERRPGSHKINR